MRGAAVATLATQAGGQPFASLVTPAVAPDGAVLLFLSTLSEHTRHLLAEPRCSLLFTGPAPEINPQTAPRVTVTGLAIPVPEDEADALKSRWLLRHPYAALYAGFGDFDLWRVRPASALLVAGFAQARRLRGGELAPEREAAAAVAGAEAELLAALNDGHAAALAAAGARLSGGRTGAWRLLGLDVDGADLGCGEAVVRLPLPVPATSPEALRDGLLAVL
ncbi:HugZ family pyridoxamine 5'-phosphate oxidase [Roseomonas gilardii]|uniref:HugZ family pyridoxamine 5'-phosphate oxidase n=1 Tax=Roseomonas gilardii TaxID=257708 RepID=UPI0004B26228|nr:pyridoxamine 5'-phosphate oxidase family protein [Roseomonas gilardii]SUE62654.1 PPOX class probable F420-dependent enzyme [Roseomonas gilardii subsp. rosea]